MTETCQYYAFFCGIATPEEYPALFEKMVKEFGPQRDIKKTYPLVYKSNAFIGNYLRLYYFMKCSLKEQAAKECVGYFYKMADLTGTLWEHDQIFGSLNHCFASFVANIIVECVTGFRYADYLNKKIYIGESAVMGDFELTVPVLCDKLTITRKSGKIKIKEPHGYEIVE